jgi:hypothetical protein
MKTSVIEFFGYAGCVAQENGVGARLVVCPQAGGRVLEYSLNGVNTLYLNPEQKGWRHTPGIPSVDSCGGRCDIGPERVIAPHPDLWLGDWTGEIVGDGKVRLTSVRDRVTGVSVDRADIRKRLGKSPRVFHKSCSRSAVRPSLSLPANRTRFTGGRAFSRAVSLSKDGYRIKETALSVRMLAAEYRIQAIGRGREAHRFFLSTSHEMWTSVHGIFTVRESRNFRDSFLPSKHQSTRSEWR